MLTDDDRRRDELATNLGRVSDRIAAAGAAAGRDPAEITLVVITKTFPAEDVRWLAELGVCDVGENRDQEAAPKVAATSDLALNWHFVGQLQTNKAQSVASYADVVHSVDRSRLVTALDRGADRAGRRLTALIQVGLDLTPGRGGADPREVPRLADQVADAAHLDLSGLMAVAPLGEDPRPAFDRLAEIAADLRRQHPAAVIISAGMSADLEDAVAAGATHLRVGSAVLGRRPRNG